MGIKVHELEKWFALSENRRVVMAKMKEAMIITNLQMRLPGKTLLQNNRDGVLLQYRTDRDRFKFQLITLEDSGVMVINDFWKDHTLVAAIKTEAEPQIKGGKKRR